MKRILKYRDVEVNSPRDTFRYAAKNNIIDDPEIWFKFLEKRNLTVHTYNEDSIEEIFKILPRFKKELNKLIVTVKKL